MFFCVICFLQKFQIRDESSVVTSFPDFGLQKYANFSLMLQTLKSGHYFVAVLDSEEYSSIPRLSFSYPMQFCLKNRPHFSMINFSFFSDIFEYKSSTIIPKADTYYLLIVSCYPNTSFYDVTIFFKNGNSLLDSRYIPCFISMPIFFLTLIFLFIPYIINQIIWQDKITGLHKYLTVTLAFVTIKLLFDYICLQYYSSHHDKSLFAVFQGILDPLCNVALISVLILAGKGWCLTNTSLQISDIIEVVSYCTIYQLLQKLFSSFSIVAFQVVLFVLMVSLLSIIWVSLISSLKVLQKNLIVHLNVIMENGISPISTPIYRKHIILTYLSYVIVFYFSYQIVIISFKFIEEMSYWVENMLYWILNIGLLASMTFLFRIRRGEFVEYDSLENCKHLTNKQFDEINTDFLKNKNFEGMKEWEEGILLPPPPIIVDDDGQSNSLQPNIDFQDDGMEMKELLD